jgi:arginyl-tRNA synthetase
MNIFLKDSIYLEELNKILNQKENYGKGAKKSTRVLVEYVSANPTGPLHIGNARGGPIGESLANLFSFLGYPTEREFYVNDLGGQIERFAKSIYYWYAKKSDSKAEFPEGGYPGDYIKEISEAIQKEHAEKLKGLKDEGELIEFFKKEGLYHTIKSIREDCKLINIEFDNWINQSDFEHSGKSEQTIQVLEEKGATAKKEGALWFKNPNDPELQDRESVLKKSDEKGTLTYFADDIAYHVDKIERGFDLMIDVWGPGHHGHIPRLKSAIRALGYKGDGLQILLYQQVRLMKAGRPVAMGKRLGNFVTLRQVIESGVMPDAYKYFILSQNPNTPFDFDLQLAADTSEKNPVFYIKYAHARICSILKKAEIDVISTPRGQSGAEKSDNDGEWATVDLHGADLTLLTDPKEVVLYKELIKFPEILEGISSDFQIQTLPHFAYKIATLFHDFYSSCRVITDDKKMTSARLSLVLATKYILKNSLNILGIEAPEKM